MIIYNLSSILDADNAIKVTPIDWSIINQTFFTQFHYHLNGARNILIKNLENKILRANLYAKHPQDINK